MGLVSEDFSNWLAETAAQPEADLEENPFGLHAERAAMTHVHALWHRAAYRVHKWVDADWEPGAGHGDHLTR
jgi:hypothetical protein